MSQNILCEKIARIAGPEEAPVLFAIYFVAKHETVLLALKCFIALSL